eukprot:5008426-Prymnesium_polylepis.2
MRHIHPCAAPPGPAKRGLPRRARLALAGERRAPTPHSHTHGHAPHTAARETNLKREEASRRRTPRAVIESKVSAGWSYCGVHAVCG